MLSSITTLNNEKLITYIAQNKVEEDPVTEADACHADRELEEHVHGQNILRKDDHTNIRQGRPHPDKEIRH